MNPQRLPLLESAWNSVRIRLPLVTFIGVYLFTCYAGAIALLTSERFRTLYLVYSGAQAPELSSADIWRILLLLHLGPAAVWIAYEVGIRVWRRAPSLAPRESPEEPRRALRTITRLLALGSVAVAVFSLGRAAGWSGFGAWNDYNAYVYARWHLFDTLTFFEFVNIYTLLPVTLACWALNERRRTLALVVAIAVTCALQYPLAIRKALLTSLILIGSIAYAHLCLGSRPRIQLKTRAHLAFWFVLPVAVYFTYVGLTLQTVIRRDSQPFQTIAKMVPAPVARKPVPPKRSVIAFSVDQTAIQHVQQDRLRSVVLYTILSPLTRTSICAVVYPAVFPDILPFYRPDFGLDILGYGTMPDDNLTVYRVLWPEHQRGSVAAPFQFVLFSQGGLLFALAGSAVFGFVLSLAWLAVADRRVLSAEHSIAAGLLIVLASFAAIDSLRNSLLVSYGLIWGFLLAGLISLVARFGGAAARVEAAAPSR